MVVRMGDPVPGLDPSISIGGILLTSNTPPPVINHNGNIVFASRLTGAGVSAANDSAIFSEAFGDGFRPVAREGDPAPGATPSILFRDLTDIPYSINANGQVAFLAGDAIYAQDAAGTLQLIARGGDKIEVSPGDFRTIVNLRFLGGSGNEDGRAQRFQ